MVQLNLSSYLKTVGGLRMFLEGILDSVQMSQEPNSPSSI